MDQKYAIIIFLILFGVTLAAYAEYSPVWKIDFTDIPEIKDSALITKNYRTTIP